MDSAITGSTTRTTDRRRCYSSSSYVGSTAASASAVLQMPMKPGTPIPGLNFRKDVDPPVALPREEYPDWVNKLAEKDISLAQLRRMPEEDATDKQKMRYLKLTRRIEIKRGNDERSKK